MSSTKTKKPDWISKEMKKSPCGVQVDDGTVEKDKLVELRMELAQRMLNALKAPEYVCVDDLPLNSITDI